MNENTEKSYKLRDLCADDIFAMCKVITDVGVKEIAECFNSSNVNELLSARKEDGKDGKGRKDAVERVGASIFINILPTLLANLPKCRSSLYEFLGSLANIPAQDVAKLPIKTFKGMLFDVVRKEDFADFFQDVIRSVK